jgi:hypothetical protein
MIMIIMTTTRLLESRTVIVYDILIGPADREFERLIFMTCHVHVVYMASNPRSVHAYDICMYMFAACDSSGFPT